MIILILNIILLIINDKIMLLNSKFYLKKKFFNFIKCLNKIKINIIT